PQSSFERPVTARGGPGGKTMALEVTSNSFTDGGAIPRQYTCDGEDRSPHVAWSGSPEGTQGYALIVHDPDAPSGDFTHWVVFDIPAGVKEFPDGAAPIQTSQEGKNSFGTVGYRGPCPPPGHGPHHYIFEVYALDTHYTGLGEGASREEVERRIEPHTLARGRITGLYERK
ncbi:MAG TPA: YbhB/YbcL family Raf kinase inhibitor-like protein, partial [Armatimonadota bacterium]|nr:YbhB/YbcL family Raf kinase inhibitor-like protein [Armatimonadota bacterium]